MTGGAVLELLYDDARYENFSKCLFLKLDSESKKKIILGIQIDLKVFYHIVIRKIS